MNRLERRGFVRIVLAAGASFWARPSASKASGSNIDKEVLRKQLTQGLRVTRDDQKAFINQIVDLVDQGKLPLGLVYATFKWARKRHPAYPFPYFQRAIQGLAKRYGIDL